MAKAEKKVNFQARVEEIIAQIQSIYMSDDIPWVIGYSGGKDSTAIVQLTWMALQQLDAEKRKKPVHVITTDTQVENPIVSGWVNSSLKNIDQSAKDQQLPFTPHLIKPNVNESFWVNLIGRGYPAPRANFRWCTERLKIRPSNRFIEEQINENGEVILLLGVRRAESTSRATRLEKRKKVEDLLYPHDSLKNCFLYAPIEDWSNDEVWIFLSQNKNPWGTRNQELQNLYASATEDNECPVVVDTTTPSCGNSRFGCWVCTLVTEDKSMTAMVQNDADREWMMPMLTLRNDLDYRSEEKRKLERERRDFRRMSGGLNYYKDKKGVLNYIPGPYAQEARIHWLKRVLDVQQSVRTHKKTPSDIKDIKDPEFLRNLDLLQQYVSNIEDVGKMVSMTDYIKEFNRAMNDGNNEFYSIPQSRSAIAQTILIYGNEFNSLVNFDYTKARISGRVKDIDSRRAAEIKNNINNYIMIHMPDYMDIEITGTTFLALATNDHLVHNLTTSFMAAFVLITIVMIFLFRSVPITLISIIPNIIPMLAMAAIMGYFDIQLRPPTAMTFAVAFGIAVDDTIHFLIRYRMELPELGWHYRDANDKTIMTTGLAMTTTTGILVAGFLILTFSSFRPTADFGLLAAATIFVALICDLTFLPALLGLTKPKIRED